MITIDSPDDDRLLGAEAYISGKPFSYAPDCISPVLAEFGRSFYAALDVIQRQELKSLIPRLIGTAGDGKDDRREWMASDWLIRTCTPVWMDLANLTQHATALRTVDEIKSKESTLAAQPVISSALSAALDTAKNSAMDASWDSARAVTRDVTRVAGMLAAWSSVRPLAKQNAALSVAINSSWDASAAASWVAAMTHTGDASIASALASLQPTAIALQQSAFELFDRMIRTD